MSPSRPTLSPARPSWGRRTGTRAAGPCTCRCGGPTRRRRRRRAPPGHGRPCATPSSRSPASSAGRSATRPATRSASWSTWWRGGRTAQTYPPVTGLVVRVGRRPAFVDATAVERLEHAQVVLRSARLDLRDFSRRPGEVMLGRDVLDHQLVDVDDKQVIRAADLYLAPVLGRVRLVGVDVSNASLLRRLGPPEVAQPPDPRPGHRLGRHPAVRGHLTGGGSRSGCGRPTRACTGCAPASWPTSSKSCAGPSARSCWPLSRRRGGRRPRGDGGRGPHPAVARVRARDGGRPAVADGARRGGRRPPGPGRGRAGGPAGPHAGGPGGPPDPSSSPTPKTKRAAS